MDALYEMINSLSPNEEEMLNQYLDAKSGGKKGLDKKLLQLLQSENEPEGDEVIRLLYGLPDKSIPTEKRNAYHQWRSRLSDNMEEFILHRMSQEDEGHEILRLMLVGRFLLSRKKYKVGYKYLQKAEALAKGAPYYYLQHRIHSLLIEYAWTKPDLNIEELTENWNASAALLEQDTTINTALGLLQYRIMLAHKSREPVDIDKLTREILVQYKIDKDSVYNNITTRYKIAMMVKSSMAEKGMFAELTDYLLNIYEDLEGKDLFNKHTRRQKVKLLTEIANAAVKARRYALCEKYIAMVKQEEESFSDAGIVNIKCIMTEYVLYINTRRLEQAVDVLKGLKGKYINQIAQEDDYYFTAIHANLLSSRYFMNDYAGARKHLFVLLNNEKRVRNFSGQIGLFCSYTLDCILNFDMGEYEYVVTKIKALKKRFAVFLSQPENSRYDTFLKILHYWSLNPNSVGMKNTKIEKELNKFLKSKRPPIGSFEFIRFTPWVISKVEKRKYYDVMSETAQKEVLESQD